uniref:Uncharacterized protein n=1 Tax=viral metagenome TaxID=1070528 RepID=A0A6C0IZY5_9ZZZZ
MDVLVALMENEKHATKRELGENIMKHAEDLLAYGKVSEGQYLDFCNGAGLIHQGVMMTQNEMATVSRMINTLSWKVHDAKTRETIFRNHIKSLQTRTGELRTRYEEAKGTMFKNASELESAIQKKEYARARSMVKDQKKKALDMVFEFDE